MRNTFVILAVFAFGISATAASASVSKEQYKKAYDENSRKLDTLIPFRKELKAYKEGTAQINVDARDLDTAIENVVTYCQRFGNKILNPTAEALKEQGECGKSLDQVAGMKKQFDDSLSLAAKGGAAVAAGSTLELGVGKKPTIKERITNFFTPKSRQKK